MEENNCAKRLTAVAEFMTLCFFYSQRGEASYWNQHLFRGVHGEISHTLITGGRWDGKYLATTLLPRREEAWRERQAMEGV